MGILLLILTTLILFIGFLGLTAFETARGTRVFAGARTKFDHQVDRAQFIIEHVDFAAFIKDEVRHSATRAGHTIVALTLQAVRAVERLLTRLVRAFRAREATMPAPGESTRAFVKTLSEFKEQLKATAPDISPETL